MGNGASMTTYNAGYHKGVVDNLRNEFKKTCKRDCTLTDEQIWRIFDNTVAPTSEEQTEWCVEEMAETETK